MLKMAQWKGIQNKIEIRKLNVIYNSLIWKFVLRINAILPTTLGKLQYSEDRGYLNNHKVIIILFHASVHDAAILNFAGIFQSNEREVTIYFVVLYSLSGETNTLKFIIYNSHFSAFYRERIYPRQDGQRS